MNEWISVEDKERIVTLEAEKDACKSLLAGNRELWLKTRKENQRLRRAAEEGKNFLAMFEVEGTEKGMTPEGIAVALEVHDLLVSALKETSND